MTAMGRMRALVQMTVETEVELRGIGYAGLYAAQRRVEKHLRRKLGKKYEIHWQWSEEIGVSRRNRTYGRESDQVKGVVNAKR